MLRTVVAGILIATLTSCTSWAPVPMSPTSYIRMRDPAAVWVQLQDGSTMVVGRPRILGDTLRGIVAGGFRNIPLKDVAVFRAKGPAKNKTALAIAAAVVVTGGIIYVATQSDHVTP
jgi:hypothetical protein